MKNPADKFIPNQPVWLTFKPADGSAPYQLPAEIVENIDHTCFPLTDMWRVRVIQEGDSWDGKAFGFSGKAITARDDA